MFKIEIEDKNYSNFIIHVLELNHRMGGTYKWHMRSKILFCILPYSGAEEMPKLFASFVSPARVHKQ